MQHTYGFVADEITSITRSGTRTRSPGKNAHLHRTNAPSTPPRLGHKCFVVSYPLALLGNAFYTAIVSRPTCLRSTQPFLLGRVSRCASFKLTVTSSQRDLHLQVWAHAGHTMKKRSILSHVSDTGSTLIGFD